MRLGGAAASDATTVGSSSMISVAPLLRRSGRASLCRFSRFVGAWHSAVYTLEANGVFSHAVGLSTLLASTQLLAGLSSELTSA